MVHLPKRMSVAIVGLAVLAGTAGCARPDPNPPMRVTGDKSEAIPATSTTTSTSTSTTSTTLYYPGLSPVTAPTTTTTVAEADTVDETSTTSTTEP